MLLIVGEILITTAGTLRSHSQISGIAFRVGVRVEVVRVRIGDSCRSLWGCESCSDGI